MFNIKHIMRSKILSHLWLGDHDDGKEYKRYDLIINLSYPTNNVDNQKLEAVMKGHTLILRIGLQDQANTRIDKIFNILGDYIDKYIRNGKDVLVHCRMGISRSVSIIIAYLMCKFGLNYKEAYEYVRERRKIANPNPGFVKRLKQYERKLNR